MSLPPPREASRATSQGLIISKYPDVCRSPHAPVPYTIVGYQNDDANTASSVFMTGQRAHKQNSIVIKCTGDEPGTGLGVKSNTVSSICHRKDHSKTVRIEGQWATRDTDEWWMNNRNTIGKLCWPKHNKSFEPTPPLQVVDASAATASDEGKVMSDASPEPLMMNAQYASNLATAPAAQPPLTSNNPVPSSQVPKGGGGVPGVTIGEGGPPQAGNQNTPPVSSNSAPAEADRWWSTAKIVGFLSNFKGISPSGPGAMEFMAMLEHHAEEYLGHPTDWGKGMYSPNQWWEKGTIWKPRPETLPYIRDNGVPTGTCDEIFPTAQQWQDKKPETHTVTNDNLRVSAQTENEQEQEKKRCDCITGTYTYVLSRCKTECGPEFQAHHIIADKCLGVTNRDDREAGIGRIPTPDGMKDLPSFNGGPAICLYGNAAVQQTQHNTAHGNDRTIAAEGRESPVKNTLPLERIRGLSEAAAIKARPDCEDQIKATVATGFDGIDPQTLLRSCRMPIKPGSPAYDVLAPKPLPSP